MGIDINTITLSGRLARKPSERTTNSGKQECKITLANGDYNDHTNWVNVVLYGKPAEIGLKYLEKGKWACITGRLRITEYDGKDGKKERWTEIVGNSLDLGPKVVESQPTPHRIPQDDDPDAVPF